MYANHPWSVTEQEAVGVPGWQTGGKIFSQPPQACKARVWGTDLADNSLDGVECTTHHLALWVWQILFLSQCPCYTPIRGKIAPR